MVGKKVLIVILLLVPQWLSAQSDTGYVHVRKRAAIFSAVLPGSGQIYNEIGHRKVRNRKHISWWRAPLYLSGMAVTGYYGYTHINEANSLRKEWLHRGGVDSIFLYEKYKGLSSAQLETNFQTTAKYRDYFIAGFIAVYALNILDAFIDAHFVTFDVSKNLSLNIRPKLFDYNQYGVGFSLKIN